MLALCHQMEMRYTEATRARDIFERYIRCIPEVKSWVRYAKFEMQSGEVPRARGVYERAVQAMDGEASMVRPSSRHMWASRLTCLTDLWCSSPYIIQKICWDTPMCIVQMRRMIDEETYC